MISEGRKTVRKKSRWTRLQFGKFPWKKRGEEEKTKKKRKKKMTMKSYPRTVEAVRRVSRAVVWAWFRTARYVSNNLITAITVGITHETVLVYQLLVDR